ncbi:MAG: hypothetical protein PHO37_14075 [Kiritimatiellae bacterium]|nr:hypothetical protein [Kiritimatiellia bacterium]
MNITSKHILTLCSFVWLAGCTTTKAPEPTPDAPLRPDEAVIAADTLYEQGRMQEAIAATIDISRKRPDAVGLAALKQRIAAQLSEERRKEVVMRAESAAELDVADAKRFGLPIESYRLQKNVVGENAPLRSALTKMQEALASPVSMHLVNADINAIIAQIGQSQNINIVADSEISEKALTIHAEDTPLIEILDYVGRNLNVEFSVGTSLIWVTPKEEVTTGVPLMTRVYKLRKGLIGSELGKTSGGKSLFKGPEERGRSSSSSSNNDKGGEEKEGAIGLLDLIDRFVPQPEGADFIFNDKAHSLIVKNTRENLAQVEELIAAMDIRPLQILIEARFITTKVNDLRELGIEWLLQRPYDFGGSEGGGGDTVAQLKRMQAAATSPEEILKIGDSIQNLSPNQFTKNAYVAKAGEAGFGGMYQTLLGETGLQATLHALQQTGNSRTVVVPRVTTLNNREATFRFGRDVSYFEEVDTNIMTSGGGYNSGESRDNVTYNYNRPTVVEVGYSLTVTPSVGADLSTINLVLRPEISNIEEWKRYRLSSLDSGKDIGDEPAIEIPTIARQYIETEAVVRSGETVVLGGLVDTLKTETSSGTPWLSKLPFIGQLFKVDKNNETANNMLIFVTATLISDMGEELIPLNERDRYGLAISADAATPNVLKGALPMRLEEFMNNAQSPAQEETPIEPTPADAPAAVPAEAAAAAMPAEAPAAPPVQPVAPPVNIAAPVEE